jgi:hypothetical protein
VRHSHSTFTVRSHQRRLPTNNTSLPAQAARPASPVAVVPRALHLCHEALLVRVVAAHGGPAREHVRLPRRHQRRRQRRLRRRDHARRLVRLHTLSAPTHAHARSESEKVWGSQRRVLTRCWRAETRAPRL